MFKKKQDLVIKGKTDEELELELKKQTLRAKLYFFVTAIVLIALIAAFKLVKNFQHKQTAEEPVEEATPEEGIILIPDNGEGSSEEGLAPQFEAPPQEDEGEYYILPDDSSGDYGSTIIEESDPGDSGPQEEIIEY
ncbi:MAG: hypothetical protein PHT31_06945 [Candidatus Omnitrophica bacterium]|nr:hypothetical protein [Candidatus Omnitrophota bacterium]